MEKLQGRHENFKQMLLVKREVPEEESAGVVLQVPEPFDIKEEYEEVVIGQEEEKLCVKEESKAASFLVSTTSVKSEDYPETLKFSLLHKHQKDNDCTTNRSKNRITGPTGERDFGGTAFTWNPNLKTGVEICNSPKTDDGEGDEEYRNLTHPNVELKPLSESDMSDSDNEWESRASGSKGNTINKSFICSDCGKEFVTRFSLKRHMIHHPKTGCSSGLFSRKCLKVEKSLDSENTVQATHSSFTCDECGKEFNLKQNLNRHKTIHTGEKGFRCELCGHSFREQSNLKKHMRTHTGEKQFRCDICGQSFSRKYTLDCHRRTHTGEKPFRCDLCGHHFSRKSNLDEHNRIHTGEKPFCCDFCGRNFSRKSDFDEHKRIHTGDKTFFCDVCGHSFSRKSRLDKHKRIHTGVKPFCCDVCGHSFTLKSALERHMRIHTGEKLFCCALCGQRFGQKSHLDKHGKIHTRHDVL